MDEFDERERFEKLLRHVEIEGETNDALLMQRLAGFYIGLVIGIPAPLAALLLHASRRDVRPASLVACIALLLFCGAASAFLGALVSPRVARWIDQAKERRGK